MLTWGISDEHTHTTRPWVFIETRVQKIQQVLIEKLFWTKTSCRTSWEDETLQSNSDVGTENLYGCSYTPQRLPHSLLSLVYIYVIAKCFILFFAKRVTWRLGVRLDFCAHRLFPLPEIRTCLQLYLAGILVILRTAFLRDIFQLRVERNTTLRPLFDNTVCDICEGLLFEGDIGTCWLL